MTVTPFTHLLKQVGLALLVMLGLQGCQSSDEGDKQSLADQSWDQLLETAKGQEVTMMMWQGDPLINRYMSDYAVPLLDSVHNIKLSIVSGQGNDIVNLLMSELEASKQSSEIDMMWINGETYYQLRQIKGLFGPFTDQLPNSPLINWDNPFIGTDFQQPVEGYECPWGNVQMTTIYRSDKIPTPPRDLVALEAWVKLNPGKFTIGYDFTGMTLLKSWLIDFAGGQAAIDGDFDEATYQRASSQLWAYLNRIKPYLWNQGESFPSSVAQMHQLFANGELWFTMSNNDSEVDNKILQGVFPESARAYVPETGTIQNSHYLGIAQLSDRKEAAMVIINTLISPAAQFHKMQPAIWGDGTVLSIAKLDSTWQQKFQAIPGRRFAPDRADIQSRALAEPAPTYMIRLFADFKKEIIES
ncbi:MAG: putative spermidine/putrescine transport system substrate-binding protein [Paraglaciecola sp.]|jgi:putative spermidine/putrescine transport system substrate-binding protein